MATGKLQIQVTSQLRAAPVEDAVIDISSTGEPDQILEEVRTDSVGQTDTLELEAPPEEYSLSPGEMQPYSEYNFRITAPGYEPLTISGAEILANQLALQDIRLKPLAGPEAYDNVVIPAHTLYGDYPPKIAEAEIKPLSQSGEIVLSRVVIPEFIVVHDGAPTDSTAGDYYVRYRDYIKNVASSEIYATWPDAAIRANILAIISFALNRVYTEFYRSRGYDFDITSSTAIDQKFINGRNIFENVGRLVDELFNTYLRRQGFVEPLAAKFCNGTTVTCDGLSQWGSQELAQQGLSSVEILRRYYGEDIEIVRNAPMRGYAPSYGGTPLRRGSRGPQVVQLQVMLNRIGQNYPAIPRVASVDGIFGTQTENAVLAAQRIFNLDPDGIVGKGTWYQLVRLYVAVTELSELASQGQTFYAVNWQYSRVLREGSTGEPVRVLQYMLQVIGSYINDVPMPPQTGIFGELTANSVRAFQRFSGLAIDGIVGEQTWNAIFDRLAGIAETGPLPQDVTQEIAEEVGYLVQAGVIPNFPGQILRLGDSDT